MSWLGAKSLGRRPIVLVEDHLYHIGEALELLSEQAAEIMPLLGVVCLDRPGPDTDRSVETWSKRFPHIRLAAAGARVQGATPLLPRSAFETSHTLAKVIASGLRPGGLLLQDIQLETLGFIPRDRWWESIYLAATVRGLFPERVPQCRFLSNKRGYEATFGSDLLEAGFDPRDVLDKNDLRSLLVPTVTRFLARHMPWHLEEAPEVEGCQGLDGAWIGTTRVGSDPEARREAESELDLIWWEDPAGPALGGKAVRQKAKKERWVFKASSPETETWRALFDDRFDDGSGVAVLEVGRRTAPDLAGRAESTNCAARHIHQLRSRLTDPGALRTVDHAYRLDRRLRVGRARLQGSSPAVSLARA